MALARVQTLAIHATGFVSGQISAQLQGGLPDTRVLGCPDHGAFRDRLRAAIKGAGYRYPASRTTLALEGGGEWHSQHLLPAALAILVASDQISMDQVHPYRWLGELNLDGSLADTPDPWLSAHCIDASLVTGRRGQRWVSHLTQGKPIDSTPAAASSGQLILPAGAPSDLAQWILAGGHSAFVFGEPGVGKSKALHRIHKHWPSDPSARSHRLARWYRRRRAIPALRAALPARASARQLQHWFEVYQGHAILIDDLPLQGPGLRDALNQTLDQHSDTALLASGNPCACGWLGSLRRACRCNQGQIQRWQRALPPPLLDRFDLLWRYDYTDATPQPVELGTVELAQSAQRTRQGCLNGQLRPEALEHIPGLVPAMQRQLRLQAQGLGLSGRAQLRAALLARTLADLRGAESIRSDDITLAIGLRANPTER